MHKHARITVLTQNNAKQNAGKNVFAESVIGQQIPMSMKHNKNNRDVISKGESTTQFKITWTQV